MEMLKELGRRIQKARKGEKTDYPQNQKPDMKSKPVLRNWVFAKVRK